jgi:thiol-disulfide isomerase/thioredoxin
MKRTVFLSFMLIALLSGFLSSAQTGNQAKVQAYYFHKATRCVTCKTVEAEAKTDLKELYGDKVSFQALNLEEKSTQELAKKLKVSGQTLLVVNGEKQVNLTNEGFLYAVTNPDKFKKIIKEKVDPLMN